MEETFSWQKFDSIARVLGSIGYLVAVLGPLLGIGMLVLGSTAVRLMGLAVMAASILIAAYHISFSLLMGAVHDITKQMDAHEHDHLEVHAGSHAIAER